MFGGTSPNKQVCQFYLKGQCKFGNKCWKSHSVPANSSNVFGGSSTNASYFGGNASGSTFTQGFSTDTSNINASENKQFIEFVKQVITEMNTWEKNGTWLLSSLSPLKDHPRLEGFIDTSPEELRVAAYEALKNNNVDSYQRFVNEKLEHHQQLRQQIKDQKTEALKALKYVFFKDKSALSDGNSFGKKEVTSLFGQSSSSQPSLFGGSSSAAATPFGGSSSTSATPFGGSSSTSATPFGGSSSTSATPFGGSSSASATPFGGSSSASATPFGGSEQAGNVFGAKPQLSAFGAAPVFGGGSSNCFGSAGGENAFKAQVMPSNISKNSAVGTSLFGGSATNTAPPSAFGGATSSIFGGAAQGSSVFSSSGNQTSSVFGAPSVFGAGASNSAFSRPLDPVPGSNQGQQNIFGSSSLFGQPQSNSSSGIFGGNSQVGSNTNTLSTNMPQQTTFSSNPGMSENIFNNNATEMSSSTNAVAPSVNPFGNNFQSNTNVFGGGNPVVNDSSTSNSTFAVSNQNSGSSDNTPSSLLGNPPANAASSGFGQNLFGTTTNTTPSNNLFGAVQQTSNLFGRDQAATVTVTITNKTYSTMESLSESDKLEFQRDHFLKIPIVPPPRELCM